MHFARNLDVPFAHAATAVLNSITPQVRGTVVPSDAALGISAIALLTSLLLFSLAVLSLRFLLPHLLLRFQSRIFRSIRHLTVTYLFTRVEAPYLAMWVPSAIFASSSDHRHQVPAATRCYPPCR